MLAMIVDLKKGQDMKTEVKIHITEDDLSESIKAKIKQLRKQDIDVELIWPENYNPDKYYRQPYITPTPAPINPIPAYPQEPAWPIQTPNELNWRLPDIYYTPTCTLN